MDYEVLLMAAKELSKERMKKLIFEVDQRSVQKIKDLEIDDETRSAVIMLLKDRTFFEMLLANALMD